MTWWIKYGWCEMGPILGVIHLSQRLFWWIWGISLKWGCSRRNSCISYRVIHVFFDVFRRCPSMSFDLSSRSIWRRSSNRDDLGLIVGVFPRFFCQRDSWCPFYCRVGAMLKNASVTQKNEIGDRIYQVSKLYCNQAFEERPLPESSKWEVRL